MTPVGSPLHRARAAFKYGLEWVEFFGLAVVGVATSIAMGEEVVAMWRNSRVTLTDLLLMFLYLEVLTMIAQYFKSGQLPVRFPLYIGMVALARYLILDLKELTEWRMLAISGAILLLAIGVLVIRYGHVRFPYNEDRDTPAKKPYVRE
ncbi:MULTISPECIES: phosphate-starvation-inducible protein PsiE [Niveibacterium]|uniref:Protein PsiE n=1 Tax=Niveibacterium microcysteis TaxID=2811415 RepID=A0ABX7M7V2_9RHOO|nr:MULTISPECIES: phosphate-starvation-inducible PsiE family protein [Niveibacterium]QSI77813.1 phosphate-starvation-inducible PsiE family protein [Niveibacterium microcysteis]